VIISVKFIRILTSKNHLNLMALHHQVPNADALHARELGENVMPRFYFHLTSKENNIPDYSGKELDNLLSNS
jgi:hypothetical protein